SPGFGTRLARSGDGPQLPQLLAAFGRVRSQKTADAAVAARDAHNPPILDGHGRNRAMVAVGRVGIGLIPNGCPGDAVQRHQMTIAGDEVDAVAENRCAAALALHLNVWLLVLPDKPAGRRIER